MRLVLVLPTGVIIRDPEWYTIGDVIGSFHAFKVRRAYGQVQTEGGKPLTDMLPMPVD